MSYIVQINLFFFPWTRKTFFYLWSLTRLLTFSQTWSKPYIFRCSQVHTIFMCQREGVNFTHLFNNITIADGKDILLIVEVLDFYPCFHIFSKDTMCIQNAFTSSNTQYSQRLFPSRISGIQWTPWDLWSFWV